MPLCSELPALGKYKSQLGKAETKTIFLRSSVTFHMPCLGTGFHWDISWRRGWIFMRQILDWQSRLFRAHVWQMYIVQIMFSHLNLMSWCYSNHFTQYLLFVSKHSAWKWDPAHTISPHLTPCIPRPRACLSGYHCSCHYRKNTHDKGVRAGQTRTVYNSLHIRECKYLRKHFTLGSSRTFYTISQQILLFIFPCV